MINLCLDFGNSRLKGAIMQNGKMQEQLLFREQHLEAELLAVLDKYQPTGAILSSVVHHTPAVEQLLAGRTRFVKLGHQLRFPVSIAYDKPETLGVDRIALVCGAWRRFPGQYSLVIGVGSAITYNFLHKNGEFLGGGISPGLEMRFKALHTFTDKLPEVGKDPQFSLIGYNTRQSILSGVQQGVLEEVDGMINRYAERYRNFNVLLTGGIWFSLVPVLKVRYLQTLSYYMKV
ncbi:type III pantothenate kinase [Chitinophaga horti]|uniref:Type III pantothenate kinase n=1 Tax=Chitinophaga horti TaxID=2920382 RepID=A0ABY6J2H2_9BACT|nr:type III pantothenate kinase [Chitinophaga horti]UYQ92561.1 type III pantothenate kinase [Chitinophaga horti]